MSAEIVREHKVALEKAGEKITEASPSTASATLKFIASLAKPLLPALVTYLVQKSKTNKDQEILRQVRDVLVEADLGD